MKAFSDYAYYYNAFYKDKDYNKEAGDVDLLLKKYGNGVNNVLLFGCGTGNHDRELLKLGYCCHGIDLSEQMIEAAKKKADENNLGITYEVADIRNYNSKEKYDAVLSLFHVMSYQTNNEDVMGALKSARKCVNDNGIFVFDAWYGPGVLTDRPAVRVKEVIDGNNKLVRHAIPEMFENENVVDVNYDVYIIDKQTSVTKTISEKHSMRYFFVPEIREYLKINGFILEACLDCNTLLTPDFSSWTVYFVARAV